MDLPDVQEREKYEEMWAFPEYREMSPGLQNVQRFMDIIKPAKGSRLLDIGCGEGVAGLEFEKHGLSVGYLDITDSALRPEVVRSKFIQAPLWGEWHLSEEVNWEFKWDYGFCCDVMEHIPTEYTMLVIERIMRSCRLAWFQINFNPDAFGQVIGKPLHLTVAPYIWWLQRLTSIANVVQARDLNASGLFVVEGR